MIFANIKILRLRSTGSKSPLSFSFLFALECVGRSQQDSWNPAQKSAVGQALRPRVVLAKTGASLKRLKVSKSFGFKPNIRQSLDSYALFGAYSYNISLLLCTYLTGW